MSGQTRLTKECAVSGCPQPIRPDKLMCDYHWEEVPLSLRTDIYTAKTLYVAKGADTSPEYQSAIKRAIQSVSQSSHLLNDLVE